MQKHGVIYRVCSLVPEQPCIDVIVRVGTCKTVSCLFNSALECEAEEIEMMLNSDQPVCACIYTEVLMLGRMAFAAGFLSATLFSAIVIMIMMQLHMH